MLSVYFDPALSDEGRREKLYAGDIIILSPSPSTATLVSLAREMLEEGFAPHDPRVIHQHMTPEQVAAVLAKLKPAFIHHPECKKLISRIMSEQWRCPGQALFRRAAPAIGLSIAFPFIRYRVCVPPPSRYVVLGSPVPDQLVDPRVPVGHK